MKSIFVLLIILSAYSATACDNCQCRMPSAQSKFTFSLNFRYTNLSDIYGSAHAHILEASPFRSALLKESQAFHGGDDLENGSYERYITMNWLINYRLSERWSLGAIIPLTKRTTKDVMTTGYEKVSTFGLGDVGLIAGFDVYHNSRPNYSSRITIQAGIKLPTGKTNKQLDDGDVAHMHVQSGSGSIDYIFIIDASKEINRWEMLADFIYRYNTEGAHHFTFGDFVNYRAGLRYYVYDTNKNMISIDEDPDRFRMAMGLNLDGEWEGHELESDEIIDNSGGHTVLISPNVLFAWSKFSIGLNYQLPIIHHLEGRQLGQSSKIVTELSFTF
ncbi:transporter [bacterium]|nr:transporter [bacterium]